MSITIGEAEIAAKRLAKVLYNKFDAENEYELANIHTHQLGKSPDGQLAFSFREVNYGHEYYTGRKLPHPVNRLHYSLRQRMTDLLARKRELEIHERPCIEKYLKECLLITLNLGDLKTLIPDAMHDALVSTINAGFPPADPVILAAFNQKYISYQLLIKQRLAANLLQGGGLAYQ